jgi:hypothetical protein
MGMKKNHEESCGECVFCFSKCPLCGSTEVDVTFVPEFHYSNTDRNFIGVRAKEYKAEMECHECGSFFDREDSRMEPMARHLANAMGLAHKYDLRIARSGRIRTKKYWVKGIPSRLTR